MLTSHQMARAVAMTSHRKESAVRQAARYRDLKADNPGERELNERGAVFCEEEAAIWKGVHDLIHAEAKKNELHPL